MPADLGIPTTMRALRLLAWGEPPEIVTVPVPAPGPGEVLIRVAGCGLCHSDLAMVEMPGEVGQALGWDLPFTLGHETAGWIHAIGEDVGGWQVGEAVALSSPHSCGACRRCRTGHESACPAGVVGRGYGRDGGLAEFVLVRDVRDLIALGALDPATAGPLTDAAATSHHAVRRVLPRLGEGATVVVLGAGGLGLFAVQILRALASTTHLVAVDPDPARRALAAARGADVVIDGVGEGTRRELRSLVGPDGADAVLDFVGTDDTISCGIGVLGPGGAFGLVGAAGGTLRRPWYGTLPRDGEVFTFQGSDRRDLEGVVALASASLIEVDVAVRSLAEAVAALAELDAGGLAGRLVVQP